MGDRLGSYYASTHALYIGTLSSKGCITLQCGKSGRQFRPRSQATEITHLGLNQAPSVGWASWGRGGDRYIDCWE